MNSGTESQGLSGAKALAEEKTSSLKDFSWADRNNYNYFQGVNPFKEKVAMVVWRAWTEMNEIKARDGVPYTHLGYKSSVDEDYFASVVKDLEDLYRDITGLEMCPWVHDKKDWK